MVTSSESGSTDSGLFLNLRAARAAEGGEDREPSVLSAIRKLKDLIRDKDRIIRDKTAELVATRDYLKSVFAALTEAVVVIDPDGAVEFVNPAAAELLETEAEELVGRPARGLWAKREQAAWFEGERLEDMLRAGGFQRTDMEFRSRTGRVIPVHWSASVLHVDGRPTGLVGIARDVRVERRIEQEKLRTVQELAASVAHEIRNPLGAVQNSVALLRRDLELEGDDATLFGIVYEETERIGTIVRQFLDFARPVRPDLLEADLGELLADVVLLAEQDERAETRKILLVADAALPAVRFDPGQIKQVVWNLLANALDAAASRVAIRARAVEGGVEVRVADDGPGIPPEVLARVFEPFRTTKATGSGLGLPISKRIVEAHGGTLRLETRAHGTTSSFTLPTRG